MNKIVQNLMDNNSDVIITLGTRISIDNPAVLTSIEKSLKEKTSEFIYMHPIDDVELQDKYTQYIKYEAGSEEGVFALLASCFISNTSDEFKNYLEDLDIGYLSGETSVGEEEFELMFEKLQNKKEITFIVGNDIIKHENFQNISELIKLINKYSNLNIVLLSSEELIDLDSVIKLNEVSDISTYNGTVVYVADSSNDILTGSSSFASAAKIKDGDTVNIIYGEQMTTKVFNIDTRVRGTIALYPVKENGINDDQMMSGYRFKKVQIKKVES